MTKKIKLTQGFYSEVDDDLFEFLNQWRWHKHKKYAARSERGKLIFMHNVVGNPPDGLEIDHIDNNGLNNTRKNLRSATRQQNCANRIKSTRNTSGYIGVTKFDKKWRAQIETCGHHISLGLWDNPIDAALAYNNAAQKLFGEYACVNVLDGRVF